MRKAASMIELVIAIVVMGIAVMTLPLLLLKTQSNNIYALQQEVILAARTKMGDTLTYRWDQNSLINDKIFVLVTNGDSDLNVSSDGIRRIGHVRGDKRRKFSPDLNISTSVANLGPDPLGSNNLDDIDDFNGKTVPLVITSQTTSLDYHFTDFNLTTTVVYVSDNANYNAQNLSFTFETNASTTTSSIKMLTLKVSDPTNPSFSPFTVRSYSCNIGESELARRSY